MSRGLAGALSCVLLSHVLGLNARYAKQLILGAFVASRTYPQYTTAQLLASLWTYAQYVVITFIALQLARWLVGLNNASTWTGPGKVLLFPGKTTHSRLFPKKHSFDYSYLVVGIPVGWEGISGGMVSVSSSKSSWWSLSMRGWYHVDPEDYLTRGQRKLGLRGKLDTYLKSQGVDPSKYPHAYLVTAARFLGYHFNPASFWYLYASDMSLSGMIIEVNNTFDERRMYLLTPQEQRPVGQIDGLQGPTPGNGQSFLKPPVFKQQWPKDFHVSPFNSRKGSYSLTASDPLQALAEGRTPIDSTITLTSSKGYGKIVARLVSEGTALDPSQMPLVQKAGFLLSWWWVGFVTFPRIVREAARLWFQRQLHVWYRPEPLKESMGRSADATEQIMELAFRRYLRSLVEHSQAAIAVKYIPSGLPDLGEELMLSPSAKSSSDTVEDMEVKILTPAFYTRFAYYAHDLEAIFSEFRESCTIWVSRPELLPKLLFKRPAPVLEARNLLDYAFFEAIRYLRRRPDKIVRPLTSSQTPAAPTNTSFSDIRDFRISSMDAFVLTQEDAKLRRQYRSLVLKMFVADRLAFGSLMLVDVSLLSLQTWLAWTMAFAFEGKMQVVGLLAAVLVYGYGY